ncbi:MAG: DUF6364 family protein [Opitutales bacterium]
MLASNQVKVDDMHWMVKDTFNMKKRVTITLDPGVHDRAKRLARKKKTTLSGLLESCLREFEREEGEGETLVDEMIGSGSLREPPETFDPLYKALRDKYIPGSRS